MTSALLAHGANRLRLTLPVRSLSFSMQPALVIVCLTGVIILAIVVHPYWVQWRRSHLRQRPFPLAWQVIVERNIPPYRYLSPQQQTQLQGHIHVLLAEKQFIGCLGLTVTLEMKLTIVAIAALLLLNGQPSYFPRLRSILVYPTAYKVTESRVDEHTIVEEQRVIRLGESWLRDQLILAWSQVTYDLRHWRDGHNVVLHEFAHQLDQEDGSAQGVPILPKTITAQQWAEVMGAAYTRLSAQVAQGKEPAIDPYGATHPAEFFAVVTEQFFEQPHSLQQLYPPLYPLLASYYGLDPCQWY